MATLPKIWVRFRFVSSKAKTNSTKNAAHTRTHRTPGSGSFSFKVKKQVKAEDPQIERDLKM